MAVVFRYTSSRRDDGFLDVDTVQSWLTEHAGNDAWWEVKDNGYRIYLRSDDTTATIAALAFSEFL